MYDKSGYEVASYQQMLKNSEFDKYNKTPAEIYIEKEFANIMTDKGQYLFNLYYGTLEKVGELLNSLLKLSVWKAPTDNGNFMERRGSGFKKINGDYKTAINYIEGLAPVYYSDNSIFRITLYNLNYNVYIEENI